MFWIAFGYVFARVCIGSIYVVAMFSYVLARFWLGFGEFRDSFWLAFGYDLARVCLGLGYVLVMFWLCYG